MSDDLNNNRILHSASQVEEGASIEGLELDRILREWSWVTRELSRHFHSIFSNWNIPKAQMEVLMYLKLFEDNVEPSVIADCMCMPRQTMTSLLDGMERDGYIERYPHPSDRRRKLVRLSEAGGQFSSQIMNTVRDYEASAMQRLTKDELLAMLRSLRKFVDALGECLKARKGVPADRGSMEGADEK